MGSFESGAQASTETDGRDWIKPLAPGINRRFGLMVDKLPTSDSFGLCSNPEAVPDTKISDELFRSRFKAIIDLLWSQQRFQHFVVFDRYDNDLLNAVDRWTGEKGSRMGGLRRTEAKKVLAILRKDHKDEIPKLYHGSIYPSTRPQVRSSPR